MCIAVLFSHWLILQLNGDDIAEHAHVAKPMGNVV